MALCQLVLRHVVLPPAQCIGRSCWVSAWLVSASLEESLEIFEKGLNLLPDEPLWSNCVRAWSVASFDLYRLNTVLTTRGVVTVVVAPRR
ncbi:hypothetical protein [Wenxinia saemankumensis]|uniref:hypothetical protein n=1 Tax=Wenxinia saemankumensis TaxID=1447782 RepID=UPI0009353021|nr:hypothetical protein [Wenxinia saemankumensis]